MKQKRWRSVLTVAGAAVGGWLGLWLLGPVLFPFALGAVIGTLAEPVIQRLRLPRWAASGLCVTGVYVGLGTAVFFLCRVLCGELTGFLRGLPAAAQSLAAPVERLKEWLLSMADRFPDGVGAALRQGVEDFFRSGAGLGTKLYDRAFELASAALRKIPDLALFLLTAVLSSFMISAQRPRLTKLWQEKAPAVWQIRLQAVTRRLKMALGGWCKAQLKLMGVTFLVLTTGFLLLRIRYPLLFALGIALIDALPVFGSGVILIPWGLLLFLQGETARGTGMLCLYGAAALLRTALEPRMLGKQIGLDPLLTLLALYAGYRFFGIWGMVMFPLAAMLIKQLWSYMERA